MTKLFTFNLSTIRKDYGTYQCLAKNIIEARLQAYQYFLIRTLTTEKHDNFFKIDLLKIEALK